VLIATALGHEEMPVAVAIRSKAKGRVLNVEPITEVQL
jgi:hypothetical protein